MFDTCRKNYTIFCEFKRLKMEILQKVEKLIKMSKAIDSSIDDGNRMAKIFMETPETDFPLVKKMIVKGIIQECQDFVKECR